MTEEKTNQPQHPPEQQQPDEQQQQHSASGATLYTAAVVKYYQRSDLEVFNLLQHPTWIFDVKRKEMFWANQAALKLWNTKTLQELLQRDYKTDMSVATEQRLNNDLNRVLRNEVIEDQWTLYPGGVATTMYTTGSAIRIRSDTVQEEDVDNYEDMSGHVAILYECQRLVEQDEAIQKETTRGVEMLRHLSIAVGQFNINGQLRYQNPKAASLFDHTGTFQDRFVDKELSKSILQTVQEGKDYNDEAEQYTRQGSRWFLVSVKTTRDPVTSESILLYSAQDITEVIQARKERVTVHEKSEFFAVIAHEIRTPLHQLVGYLDLFELEGLNQCQCEALQIMQSSSTLLMSIINDLLDYTKLENGRLQLEHIAFCPHDVIQSCLATVEASATQKGLCITDHIGHNIPNKIMGDPNRIRQILLNLLSNAIKFTKHGMITIHATVVSLPNDLVSSTSCDTTTSSNPPHDPSVSVTYGDGENDTKEDDDIVMIRFEVSDTGIGIDPKHQATLFRKYQQGNKSIARHYGGTGLGLAICKSLADLMNAQIGISSSIVGVGTRVFLEVPFQVCHSSSSSRSRMIRSVSTTPSDLNNASMSRPLPQQQPCSILETKKKNILVVEDNVVSQKMVSTMLKKLGYIVSVAENGQVAVDMVRSGSRYDVILMDVQMPIMDGIEATRMIRRDRMMQQQQRSSSSSHPNNTTNTKEEEDSLIILGLTAAYENSDLDYYKSIGMNGCIGKPIRLEGLNHAICSAV
jgi:signal transduction histidine kinase/CheY-like chemotaxis protein